MDRFSVVFYKRENEKLVIERRVTRDHWRPCKNMVHYYVGHERYPEIVGAAAYDGETLIASNGEIPLSGIVP